MRMDRRTFEQWPNKAISFLGMSGVGKTTVANRLPKSEWFHYSADYRIGTKYLEEPILDNIKHQAMAVPFLRDLLRSDSIYMCSNITVHNLEPLSTFLGKIGNPARGGLTVEEFKRRQRLHREAEIGATRDVVEFIAKGREIYGYPHFIADTSGSICELEDPQTLATLAAHTLVIYIRASDEMAAELTRRALIAPKPLYYQESFLDERLHSYLGEHALTHAEEMDPNDFVRWIFPALVAHRRPLYESIVNAHAYAIDADVAAQARDEADLLELIGATLDNNTNV
jgi:hypothetical protein